MTSRTEGSRAARSAPRGVSKRNPAFAMVFFARTMRWAIVASLERNARAISSVVSPPMTRSVSAARASGERMGWQAVKMKPSTRTNKENETQQNKQNKNQCVLGQFFRSIDIAYHPGEARDEPGPLNAN